MPAIAQSACGSRKIRPSSLPALPTARPAWSYARRNHSPSQPCASTAAVIRIRRRAVLRRGRVVLQCRGERGVLACRQHEQRGDHHRFRAAVRAHRRGLERLVRIGRVRVEVEAIVPVGAADQGQPVRAEPRQRVTERRLDVIAHRGAAVRRVLERDDRVEQVGPAGFAHVGGDAEHEPQRVVVEAVADLGIAGARQRLVLVIGAAVALLRGREVHEPRAHFVRHHVHDAEAVLVRVAEADAAAAAGLEQRRAARELERHHALVGIPGVDEVVELRIGRADLQRIQPRIPAAAMRGKGALGVSRILEPGPEPARGGDVGRAVARPLVLDLVLRKPGREDELGRTRPAAA